MEGSLLLVVDYIDGAAIIFIIHNFINLLLGALSRFYVEYYQVILDLEIISVSLHGSPVIIGEPLEFIKCIISG